MSVGFVDTGAWLAQLSADDQHHHAARGYFRGLPTSTRLVTSNLVIAETATALIRRRRHDIASEFRRRIASAEQIGQLRVVYATPDVFEGAWEIALQYRDQVLSFCDCVTAVFARQLRADYIVGFDRDFTILGFELRP